MDEPLAQAEPTPAPSLPAPDASLAAAPDAVIQPTTQPAPAPTDAPTGVDFDAMDGEAYAQTREAMLAQPPTAPGEPATVADSQTPAPAEPAAPANEEPESPPPPPEQPDAPDRIRLGGLSEADRKLTSAAVLVASARGISVAEAMALLSGAPAAAAAPEPPAPAPESPDAIRARITGMRAERKEAGSNADTVRMAELNDLIDDARDALVLTSPPGGVC